MRVIIAAAGTAGHINPGIAIANKIKEIDRNSKIIFIGNDVSQNTKDKLNFLIRKKDVKLVDTFSSAEITQALGKERKLVSVTDSGFSKAMIKNLNEGVWFDG